MLSCGCVLNFQLVRVSILIQKHEFYLNYTFWPFPSTYFENTGPTDNHLSSSYDSEKSFCFCSRSSLRDTSVAEMKVELEKIKHWVFCSRSLKSQHVQNAFCRPGSQKEKPRKNDQVEKQKEKPSTEVGGRVEKQEREKKL